MLMPSLHETLGAGTAERAEGLPEDGDGLLGGLAGVRRIRWRAR